MTVKSLGRLPKTTSLIHSMGIVRSYKYNQAVFISGQKALLNIPVWASQATNFILEVWQVAKCLCSHDWEYLAEVFDSWRETIHLVIDSKGLSPLWKMLFFQHTFVFFKGKSMECIYWANIKLSTDGDYFFIFLSQVLQ